MKVVSSPEALERFLKRFRTAGKIIGFVPTMGDLHEGHASLIRAARRECAVVVVSVFVNPKQFGAGEDYRRYPRNISKDARICRREKADILFAPSVKHTYPGDFQTTVDVTHLSKPLCGKDRPGHFRGVATVVARLFGIVRPGRAYFGLKDYQQALVIRQMVRDLAMPVALRFCPLIRDKDGLALSSRNRYLSSRDRLRARSLSKSLELGARLIREGVRSAQTVRRHMHRLLAKSVDRVHYVSAVDPETLEDMRQITGHVLLAVAAKVGQARLIDNMIVRGDVWK